MLTYPFNYSNSLTDSWACTFVNATITYMRAGTSTVTADGYGTCITPAGTYSNVMRLHVRQVYKDSAIGLGFVFNYNNDEYLWYRQGTHYPMAIVYSFTITSFSTPQVTTCGGYLNNVVSGVEEMNLLSGNFNVFPNPAADELHVVGVESEKGEYVICNSMGQTVKSFSGTESLKTVDISGLAQGIYFIQLRYEGVLVRNEKFVVTR